MPLLELPTELLLMIANEIIDDYDERCFADFNSFLQVNRTLYVYLNTILWQEAAACEGTTERALTHLINTNNLARLKFFLELGADVETTLPSFDVSEGSCILLSHPRPPTPLTVATYLDNVAMARLFLEKGAKLQWASDDDDPCLHAIHAARSAEMVQLLLDHGADPELADCTADRPLHQYAHRRNIAAMRVILQNGADVNSASGGTRSPARTPLHEAVERSIDAVETLLEFGADVKKNDITFNTSLHDAVSTGDTEIVKLLLERCPEAVKARNFWGSTPLHLATRRGQTDIVRLFLEYWPEGSRETNGDGNTPLHLAAVMGVDMGMMGVFRLLVESWPEGRVAVNQEGRTPLQEFEYHDASYQDIAAEERRAIVALLGGVCRGR
jgi:ankyrin repeat protein